MARFIGLLTFAIGFSVLSGPSTSAEPCSEASIYTGTCNAYNTGDSTVLEGTENQGGGSGGGAASGTGTGTATPPPPPPPAPDQCSPTVGCEDITAPGAVDPVVTLIDIAAFRPATPTITPEPGAWAIVGLPANFVAGTAQQVVAGTLLGRAADVRFTPASYHWEYGDGVTRDTSDAGSAWAALGLRDFDPTPTSHVYAASGTYTATLTVRFAAEYRFAGSAWRSVAGTVAAASAPLTITTARVDTVLTRGDCRAHPRDPGC